MSQVRSLPSVWLLVIIAMGTKVIATGRNEEKLAAFKCHIQATAPNEHIGTMRITGDEAEDLATLRGFGTIDAVLYLTPPQASRSSHLRSATSALRRNGRVSMMGFVDQIIVPWAHVAKIY